MKYRKSFNQVKCGIIFFYAGQFYMKTNTGHGVNMATGVINEIPQMAKCEVIEGANVPKYLVDIRGI